MINKPTCPICGEGQTSLTVKDREVTYKDVAGKVEIRFSTCDTCGSDIAGEEEARINKRAMINFHKQVDGMLTGNMIHGIRQKFEITQQQAASIFGGGITAFSKYENDDIVQNTSMDRLLRVTDAVPGVYDWLNKRYGNVDIELSKKVSLVEPENIAWNDGEQIAVFYHGVRALPPVYASCDNTPDWENEEELKLASYG